MSHFRRSQIGGVVSALLLCAAWAAHAQDSATTNSSAGNNSATSSGPVLGPPALKDFQLEPRERLVTQPAPSPQRPAVATPAQPSPAVRRPVTADRPAVRPTEPPAPRPDPSPEARSTVTPPSVSPLPPARNQPQSETLPSPLPDSATTPPTTADLNPPRPPSEAAGGSAWLYAVPFFALLVVGLAFLRRRRRQERPAEPHVALPANPPTIAAEPRTGAAQRPWLELDLKAQRASYTDTEWVVQFELSVSNTGPIPARDLRIDVMLFNAGKEQDKEISAFFRTAGREATKLNLPGLKAGETGIIDGEVAMALAEMRAMKLSDRTLFIPVVAVNGLYEWGEGGSGQTAKSYIVGRELQEPSDKMGAFRVDLGPRIWRMVGQRPHKLARRF